MVSWSSATKHDLQVLLGHLKHAATLFQCRKTRHLIDAMSPLRLQSHYTRLNALCRSDLAGFHGEVKWDQLLPSGLSVTADESGSWGCGAFCSLSETYWFQVEWPPSWVGLNIAAKELLPLVIGEAIWGSSWRGLRVSFYKAVIQVLLSHLTRDPVTPSLLSCCFSYSREEKPSCQETT